MPLLSDQPEVALDDNHLDHAAEVSGGLLERCPVPVASVVELQ